MNRERLYDKIRALLAKTTENGCTEAEALAALAKARAMMDAYEVSVEDLKLAKDEAAILQDSTEKDDRHGIARYLITPVAMFCECDGWRRVDKFIFCGAPSDVALANWLHKHLTDFVKMELAGHLMKSDVPKGARRRIINGFVLGCVHRIKTRVEQMVAQSKAAAARNVNSRALVVIKADAIADKKASLGINLRTIKSNRTLDNGAYSAGQDAGNRATLGRPVDSRGGALLLK